MSSAPLLTLAQRPDKNGHGSYGGVLWTRQATDGKPNEGRFNFELDLDIQSLMDKVRDQNPHMALLLGSEENVERALFERAFQHVHTVIEKNMQELCEGEIVSFGHNPPPHKPATASFGISVPPEYAKAASSLFSHVELTEFTSPKTQSPLRGVNGEPAPFTQQELLALLNHKIDESLQVKNHTAAVAHSRRQPRAVQGP